MIPIAMQHPRLAAAFALLVAIAAQTVHAQPTSAPLPPPHQRETIAGVDVTYTDAPVGGGSRVRLIVTRPVNAARPVPVVLLVGWLSCDSVSWPNGPPFGLAHLLIQIARESGLATVRMEKPGVGDSTGAPCATLDFEHELAAYRATFAALARLPGIDASRIFLLGMSNGAGFAPLVADGAEVSGYIFIGGWVKTWYEHMLEHERRRLALIGRTPGQVNATMGRYEIFYENFLIEGLTPGEIIRRHPDLKRDWYDAGDGQYGRPAAFFQQLQALNLADAWSKVNVPVLIVHGEYDWVMSADDHRIVAELVASNGARLTTLIEAPKTTHTFEIVPDAKSAYDGSGPYNADAGAQVIRWLREQARH